jgi:ABC-type multidrug transport system fused ATPase/permease subunit
MLLCQLQPSDGRITLGGTDVRKFDKTEWARAVSLVNQEPVLFAMSVAENIAYGLPNKDVSQEEIVEAAKAANAHDFVVGLPEGYDTLVGERGSLLSGGQRQVCMDCFIQGTKLLLVYLNFQVFNSEKPKGNLDCEALKI